MATVTVTNDTGEVMGQWDDCDRLEEDATEGGIGDLSFSFARTALINEIRDAVSAARHQEKKGS